MLDGHVLGDGVAAPAAATERQGRIEREVVDVADAAEARGHVHQKAARLHALGELRDFLLLVELVDPEVARVAEAAVVDEEGLGDVEGVVEVLALVHAEDRRELLVSEGFGDVRGGRLADQNLRRFRHLEARELRDGRRLLADDLRVERAVDEHRGADLVLLLVIEDVAAALRELGLHLVVDRLVDDDRLLRRADHAVVERLRVDDGVDRGNDVAGLVEDRGRVAGADADGRGARAVGRLHHAGTARREDEVALLHDEIRLKERRGLGPADDVLRGAGLDGRVEDDLRGRDGAVLGARVRGEDDAVPGLEGHEGLEDRGRGRVRRRDHRAQNADRLGDLDDAGGFVALDDAAGLRVAVLVVDVLRRVVVLDHLVLDDAHAGLFDRHFGKGNTLLVGRDRRRAENRIDLFLGVGGVDLLGRADLLEHFLHFGRITFRIGKRSGAVDGFCHDLGSFLGVVKTPASGGKLEYSIHQPDIVRQVPILKYLLNF